MKIADMLNPTVVVGQLSSPPPSPRRQQSAQPIDYFLSSSASSSSASSPTVTRASDGAMSTASSIASITSTISNSNAPVMTPNTGHNNNGKPRSRFSDLEDAIICDGVRRGLTWGQISGKLPHRKRATCFNRYRTLQGIRKSRSNSSSNSCISSSNNNNKVDGSPNNTNEEISSDNSKRKFVQRVSSNSSNNGMMRSPPVTPPASTNKTAPSTTPSTTTHSWIPTTPPSRISDARSNHPYQHHHHLSCHAENHSSIREYPTLVAPLPTRLPFHYNYIGRNNSGDSNSSRVNNGAH